MNPTADSHLYKSILCPGRTAKNIVHYKMKKTFYKHIDSVTLKWFFPPSHQEVNFYSLWEVQTATRKSFNISLLSREIYENYQIFISRQQPPVKALRNFCCWRSELRQGVRKRRDYKRRGSVCHAMQYKITLSNLWIIKERTWKCNIYIFN